MTSMLRKMFIDYHHIADKNGGSANPEYLAVCKRQGKAKNEKDRLFERFSEEEKAVIQNYDEGKHPKEPLKQGKCICRDSGIALPICPFKTICREA